MMRRNRRSRNATRPFESLEPRRLMATVNVADFGARVNDGQDDTNAIRAAIAASRDGDTIVFSPGVFNLSSTVALASNRTYTGGGTLKKSDTYAFTTLNERSNITVDGLIFDGAGITAGNDRAVNFTIRNSTFQNINGGGFEKNGVFWGAGAINSRIQNNKFINIMGHNGIYGFARWDDTEITGNYFETVAEGIHLAYDGQNLRVANNWGKNIHRMAIELQGTNSVNTVVENNSFVEWSQNRFSDSFAYSIMNFGTGTVVRNNYASSGLKGQFDPRRNEAPIGIEFSGNNGLVEGNVIDGFRDGLHIVQADGATVRNNIFRWHTETAIWVTGVGSATNLRIHGNTSIDSYRGFLLQGNRTAGGIIENNTVMSTNGNRFGRGAVGPVPGITYRNNKFQNILSVYEEAPGSFSASGNIAYNSGFATNGFIAQRYNDAQLPLPNITYPGPGTTTTPTNPTPPPTTTPTAPTAPTAPTGTGTGLFGQYFKDRTFSTLGFSRTDGHVNFDWGWNSPGAGVSGDNFSVRWTGQVQPRTSGTYTFYTTSDDGMRLWVNGQQIINNWVDQAPSERSGTITLEAGKKYDIKMEYYEHGGGAVAKLAWAGPGQSKQIIPSSQLYPATASMPTPPPPTTAPTAPAPTEPTPSDPVTAGNGLRGEYFSGRAFETSRLVRTDGTINFDWGYGTPGSNVTPDYFSARWTGQVQADKTETYTFHTFSDDGVRLWVNDKLLIDNWTDHAPTEDRGTISLEAGKKYNIKMEYYESRNGATAKLLWSSPSTAKAIIPSSKLFNTSGAIVQPAPTPPPPTSTPTPPPATGGVKYLSDLPWVEASGPMGGFRRDASISQQQLRINGTTFAKGLGTHSASSVTFNLGGQYNTFSAQVGIDDAVGDGVWDGSAQFLVYVDGKLVKTSSRLEGKDGAESIQVDVTGAQSLRLVTNTGGLDADNDYKDHANWADAKLS